MGYLNPKNTLDPPGMAYPSTKPRVFIVKGTMKLNSVWWACSKSGGVFVIGATPREAYEAWLEFRRRWGDRNA